MSTVIKTFTFPPKYPVEVKKSRYIDFGSVLLDNETLVSGEVSSDPSGCTSNVTITDSKVIFDVSGGSGDTTITFTVIGTGSEGTVCEAQATMYVQEPL